MKAGGHSSSSPSHLPTNRVRSVLLIIAELARGPRWGRNLEDSNQIFCLHGGSKPQSTVQKANRCMSTSTQEVSLNTVSANRHIETTVIVQINQRIKY